MDDPALSVCVADLHPVTVASCIGEIAIKGPVRKRAKKNIASNTVSGVKKTAIRKSTKKSSAIPSAQAKKIRHHDKRIQDQIYSNLNFPKKR